MPCAFDEDAKNHDSFTDKTDLLAMIRNWKNEIGTAWLVKQHMMFLDSKKIFPYHMPELAANEEQIQQTEIRLGHSLDSRYREFLKCANGWPAFWHSTDLFGTEDLISGPRNQTGEFQFSMLADFTLQNSDVKRSQLLVIASTKDDKDLFCLTRPSAPNPGRVIWFAGEEVERFQSFDDFFTAMIEYARQDIKYFEGEQRAD